MVQGFGAPKFPFPLLSVLLLRGNASGDLSQGFASEAEAEAYLAVFRDASSEECPGSAGAQSLAKHAGELHVRWVKLVKSASASPRGSGDAGGGTGP